ncbi:hypothetical protein [Pedobacter endophyticus]|uniref:Uncharacterized protein n=1 Tax=Pedobacter endophyticus TaxID=2789740 RepID=A0A7U3Q525_9SPHI|nr:hypothetical protein [Pedobacter endophyticus]QPH38743.1 hypothetical protein IZT61_16960 [Pedobacter endophyticus]
MIPEIFREDQKVNVRVFGFEVNVDYHYHWPSRRSEGKEPLAVHLEFRSDSKVISSTGYKSHFLFSAFLKDCGYTSIEELCTALGEHLARENGYEPPEPEQQLSLF